MIEVAVLAVTVPATVPNSTVAPVSAVPVMVTVAPPAGTPAGGLTRVTDGEDGVR